MATSNTTDFFDDLAIATPQGNFFISWIAITWILGFPLGVLFWQQRKSHPIEGRHPNLMLVAVTLFQIFVTVVDLERAYPQIYQCEAFIVVTIVVFGLALWTMFLRVWAVFFKFMTTFERAKPKNGTGGDKTEGWFVAHRWMASSMALQIALVVGLVVLAAVAIIIGLVTHAEQDSGVDSCAGRNGVFIFMGVEVIVVGICFAIFACILRKTPNDSMFIKKELTAVAIVCLLAVVLFLPLSLIGTARDFARTTFSFPALICSITGALIVAVCIVYPLSKLHIQTADPNDPEKETLTLFECLDHVDGRESFREFLITEFSVENILVLDDIDYFKELVKNTQAKHQPAAKSAGSGSMMGNLGLQTRAPASEDNKTQGHVAMDVFKGGGEDGDKILSAARALYKRYIVPGAPDQVNLPSATVVQVQTDMGVADGAESVWNGTVFDTVKEDIESLCRRDSFPRYCRSPQGKEFKKKMGKQQLEEKRRGLILHFLKLLGLCCAACCAGIITLCSAF